MDEDNSGSLEPIFSWEEVQKSIQSCANMFLDHSPSLSKSVRLSSSVVLNACDIFSELHASKDYIFTLLHSAAELQFSLGAAGRVHVVIESALTDKGFDKPDVENDTKFPKRVSVLPLFSPTLAVSLLQSIHDSDERHTFSAQIIELFARAERITELEKNKWALKETLDLQNTDQETEGEKSRRPEEITPVPDWSITDRYKRRRNKLTGKLLEPPRGEDVIVNYELFCKTEELSDKDLEGVYGNVFCTLHEAAKRSEAVQKAENSSHGIVRNTGQKTSKNYNGAIVYYNWTLPWLRRRMNFMCGKRNDEPVRFERGYLPNKRWCRKKERRDLCRSILAEWLRIEVSTRHILLRELAKHKVFIPDAGISSCAYGSDSKFPEHPGVDPMDLELPRTATCEKRTRGSSGTRH